MERYINLIMVTRDLVVITDLEITTKGTPIAGTNKVIYQPNKFFHGNDSFIYYASDTNPSNDATVSLIVDFVAQPPEFSSTIFTLNMQGGQNRYEIDIESLLIDPDESKYYTLTFLTTPIRGIWSSNTDGETSDVAIDFSKSKSVKFKIDEYSPILYVTLDQKGGEDPYFTFVAKVSDSYGLTSTTTLAAAGKVNCAANTNLNIWSKGDICLACPAGAVCSPTGAFNITNAAGYYPMEQDGNLVFIPCFPTSSCPQGNYKNNTMTCGEGYGGTRCGSCALSYYTYGNLCYKCPEIKFEAWQIGLIAIVVLVILLYLAYQVSKLDVAFIGIVYTYFQAISAFHSLNLKWPPLVKAFLGYMTIFNLNINIMSPECFKVTSNDQSFEFKYYVTLAMPIALCGTAVILYVIYLFREYVKRKSLFGKVSHSSEDIPEATPRKHNTDDDGIQVIDATSKQDKKPVPKKDGVDSKANTKPVTPDLKSNTKSTTPDPKTSQAPIAANSAKKLIDPPKTSISKDPKAITAPSKSKSANELAVPKTEVKPPNTSTTSIHQDSNERKRSILSKVVAGLLVFIKFLFLTLSTTALSIWNCRWDKNLKHYYFEPSPNRLCYVQDWWFKLYPISVCAVLFYIIGTALLVPALERYGALIRVKMENEPFTPTKIQCLVLDVTTTKYPVYRRGCVHWDFLIFTRKLAFSCIVMFISNQPATQAVLLIIIFQTFLIIHSKYQPYVKPSINKLEEMSLIGSCFVLLAGVLTYVNESDDPQYLDFLGIIIITFISLSAVGMFWNVGGSIWASVMEYRKQLKMPKSSLHAPDDALTPKKDNPTIVTSNVVKTAELSSPLTSSHSKSASSTKPNTNPNTTHPPTSIGNRPLNSQASAANSSKLNNSQNAKRDSAKSSRNPSINQESDSSEEEMKVTKRQGRKIAML